MRAAQRTHHGAPASAPHRDLREALRHLPLPDDTAEIIRKLRQPPPPPAAGPRLPFPQTTRGGVLRYPCPHDCGWHHDEHPGSEPPLAIRIPIDHTSSDISHALTQIARQRQTARLQRVHDVINRHLSTTHPAMPLIAR